VHLVAWTPQTLSREEREAFEELEKKVREKPPAVGKKAKP